MQFSITIVPDEGLKKKVDALRYRFDRKLVKEKYPYMNLFGPVDSFANLKRLAAHCKSFLKKSKRFRVNTDVFSFLKQDSLLFLNVPTKKPMVDAFDFFSEVVDNNEHVAFFPHIVIAKNHSLDELLFIYEELKDSKFDFNYLVDEISIAVKEGNQWEEYEKFIL